MPHRISYTILLAVVAALGAADDALAQRQRFGPPEKVFVSLARSTEAETLVKEFEQMLEQDRRFEAVTALQNAMDRFAFHPVQIAPGRYDDLVVWGQRRIAEDAKLLRAYRDGIGPRAKKLWEQARAKRDVYALEWIRLRFAMTDAGANAAMDLAGLDLERGEPGMAAVRLQRLTAAPLQPEQRERLQQLKEAAERVGRWAQKIQPAIASSVPNDIATALNLAAKHTVDAFDTSGRAQRRKMELDPTWGMLPWGLEVAMWDPIPPFDTATPVNRPTSSGGRIYISTGRSIRAVDTKTLKADWVRTFETPELLAAARAVKRSVLGWHVMDPRGVAVDPQRVYGVMGRMIGHPLGDEDEMKNRWGFSLLAAVDAKTGAVHWTKRPVQWAADLTDVALHGTPIVLDGRLLVLGHTIDSGVHQTTHLFAVDPATGGLLWRRRIASVEERINGTIASHAAMVVHDGRVIVSDGLGFVLRIDPVSGAADWNVALLAQEDTEGRTLIAVPTDFTKRSGAPVAADAGLIVPMRLREVGAVVIDIDTGERRRNLTGDWVGTRHLLVDDGDVYVVTDHAAMRCAGATLDTKWKLATKVEAPPEPDRFRGGFGRRVRTSGATHTAAPTLTPSQLLVPVGRDKLWIVEKQRGSKQATVQLPGTGQFLPHGRSLIVGGNGKIWRLDP